MSACMGLRPIAASKGRRRALLALIRRAHWWWPSRSRRRLRIKAGIALAKAAGYSGEYITDKSRIEEILPGINTENVLGAGYTRDDGYFDGTMISNTL